MESPLDEINFLLQTTGEFCIDVLERRQSLMPGAAVVGTEGTYALVHVDAEDSDSDEALLDRIQEILRAGVQAGEYKAALVYSQVRFIDPETGVEVEGIKLAAEHPDHEPITCYLPFVLDDSAYEYGEPIFVEGDRVIFTS